MTKKTKRQPNHRNLTPADLKRLRVLGAAINEIALEAGVSYYSIRKTKDMSQGTFLNIRRGRDARLKSYLQLAKVLGHGVKIQFYPLEGAGPAVTVNMTPRD